MLFAVTALVGCGSTNGLAGLTGSNTSGGTNMAGNTTGQTTTNGTDDQGPGGGQEIENENENEQEHSTGSGSGGTTGGSTGGGTTGGTTGGGSTGGTTGGGSTTTTAISFASQVQPLASRSCSCHTYMATGSMADRANILAKGYVVAGNAAGSRYVTVGAGGAGHPGGNAWGANAQLIRDWIAQGAQS
jgi:hypothetical protein